MMNKAQSSQLIRVLRWDNFYKILIEISLLIILYLSYMWPAILHSLKKVICIPLHDLHFYLHDLEAEFHLFTLSISRVVHDQVWYERPLFYNSNFSKPNGLASLFVKAQLDKIKLHFAVITPGSAVITPGFYFCRNISQRLAR